MQTLMMNFLLRAKPALQLVGHNPTGRKQVRMVEAKPGIKLVGHTNATE